MKKYARILGIWLVCVLFIPPVVWAAEKGIRIGFVNTGRIYREAKDAAKIAQRLEREFSDRSQELKKLGQRREALFKKLQKAKAPDDIRHLERKFASVSRDYRVKAVEIQEDYNQRRDEEFSALRDKANAAVMKIAKEGGFDLILQEAIVYASPRIDMTELVLDAMDE